MSEVKLNKDGIEGGKLVSQAEFDKVTAAKRKKAKAEAQAKINRENRIKMDIADLRKKRINEPTRTFEVGERVQIGNLDYTEIREIFDGGKFYRVYVEHEKRENVSRKRYTDTSDNNFWEWTEIEKYQTYEELVAKPVFLKERLLTYQNPLPMSRAFKNITLTHKI